MALGRVISGRAITENGVAKKVQEHIENIRKNKSKATKPHSVSEIKIDSQILLSQNKTNLKNWKRRQPQVYSHLHNLVQVSEDSESELTDTDDENILEAEKCCL